MTLAPTIRKVRGTGDHNLVDYAEARSSFDWATARRELASPPGRGLNMAYEALERHASCESAYARALVWIGESGARRALSYRELCLATSRLANVLAGLGVVPGDRVFTLLGTVPELYIAMLGTLKHRAVAGPLFAAFGPEPVATRLRLAGAKVLVTRARLYERRIAPIRERSETALMEHAAVAEVGVIEKPDAVAMEIVKAFVSLRPGYEATEDLEQELLAFGRRRLGPVVAPRELAFEANLPRTRSGKIMRRMLRARELGLPEGDTSTLEDARGS